MKRVQLTKMLVARRWLVYYFTIGLALIMLGYSLLKPKIYRSTGQVLPQQETTSMFGLTSLLAEVGKGGGARIAGVAKAAGLSLGSTPSDLLKSFLTSRTLLEKVIVDLDLLSAFKIRKRSMETGVKALRRLIVVEVTREDVIMITVQYKKPMLAADIVNSLIKNLDLFLKEKSMSKAKYERIFLEKRLTEAALDLQICEESLRVFQERHKTISPTEETKAAITAYADLKTKLFARELESDILGRYSASESPYYASSQREVQEFRKKLAQVESGSNATGGFGVGFGISFRQLPALEMAFLRRYRDVRVREEIYGFLIQQYEQAKIAEARDTPTIAVIDWGRVPERKAAPKRIKYLIGGLLGGFLLGLLAAGLDGLSPYIMTKDKRTMIMIDILDAFKSDLRLVLGLFRR